MSRRILLNALIGLAALGCGRPAAPPAVPSAATPTTETTRSSSDAMLPALPPVPLSAEAQYDAALGEAMARLSEGQLAPALTALEKARSVKDTDLVRGEIDRLKQRIDQQNLAGRAAEDIRIVLKQGRADEAARLASLALGQFGGGAEGDTFAALKRQADALLAGGPDAARADQFRKEAEAAAANRNLRAAVIAYDQSLAARPDPSVQQQADQLRQTLARYDDLRRQAVEARRNPARMDEAMDLYRQAGALWDTPENRADWDACALAVQNRRDRVAIADFEVRGDIGIPNPGRVVAEELMPKFRGRFDVVERQQVDKVVNELRLEAGDVWSAEGPRRELARLANVRYIVLGSVTPSFGGIVVQARMVEAASGLVVQTARITAADPRSMMALLPNLALMLQMSDAELRQYEQTLTQQPPVNVIEQGPMPPPPPQGGPPPAAIVPVTLRPPTLGGVLVDDFGRLPPVTPPGGVGMSLVLEKDHKARLRVTHLALELGDNLFRRGLLRDAHAQYQLALNLNPGQADIQVRLDRCRPSMPPPPPPRQRLVVLDFVSPGDGSVQPGLGIWTAQMLAPYYQPPYDVLDRGTVSWYMGRLGLTLRDVIIDPAARAYLGQALEARYFLVGTIRQTRRGLEVTAHLLDAAIGARIDMATIVARNPVELKLRLPEIARWMLTDPNIRVARLQEADSFQVLIGQAEGYLTQGQFPQAIGIYQQCLKVRPDDVQVQSLLLQAERQARMAEIADRRRVDHDAARVAMVRQREQQELLMRESAAARAQAERAAAAVAEADRQRQQRAAYERLVVQARAAREKQQWQQSAELFTAALAIDKSADLIREHDAVKARLAESARLRAAEESAAREAAMRKQRDEEIARLREQTERDRRRRDEEERARKARDEERDQREFARLMDNAKKLAGNNRYDEAIDLANQARRIRPNPDVDQQIGQWVAARKSLSESAKQKAADQARADAEAKLKADAAAAAAAAAAMAKQQQPPVLPKEQPKVVTPPPLPKEQPKVETPPPLPKEQPKVVTPPPLPKEQPKAVTPPPLPKEQPKAEMPPPLPKEQPKVVTPPPLPKEKEKAKVEQPKTVTPPPIPKEKEKAKAPSPPPLPKEQPKAGPPAEYTKKVADGANAERQGKYADARAAYLDALKAVPGDPAATARAEYARLMDVGGKALLARKSAEAVAAYEAALKIAPGDQAAQRQLQRAKSAK